MRAKKQKKILRTSRQGKPFRFWLHCRLDVRLTHQQNQLSGAASVLVRTKSPGAPHSWPYDDSALHYPSPPYIRCRSLYPFLLCAKPQHLPFFACVSNTNCARHWHWLLTMALFSFDVCRSVCDLCFLHCCVPPLRQWVVRTSLDCVCNSVCRIFPSSVQDGNRSKLRPRLLNLTKASDQTK